MTAPRPGRLHNWAGNVTFTPERVERPSSVEQLQELVAGSRRIRALGTGHSFNRIADSPGKLVSVAGLPATIEVDRNRAVVRVSAGARYGEVAAELHRQGLALHNLGSLPHLSVAGACSTGTHGSGDANGGLATAVSAVELVTADGEIVALSREQDGDRLNGAVVGLGALGVVTALTLDVQPTFDVRQYVYEDLPFDVLDDHFAQVMGSAYSVSLFTNWQADRIDQVWRKHRVDADDSWRADPVWFGAALATAPRHPLPGLAGDVCTDQLGVPGPWNERLPHFRLEFTPSYGAELQSEYLVPRERAMAALRAVAALRDLLAPVLLVSEIRTVAADALWLSPSYARDTVAFHFTWVKDQGAVDRLLPALEESLAPMAARPHWGKVFSTSGSTLRSLYPRFADFERLRSELDPDGKFGNDFLDRCFSAA